MGGHSSRVSVKFQKFRVTTYEKSLTITINRLVYDLVHDFSKSSTDLDIRRFPDLFPASGPLRQGLSGKNVSGAVGNMSDHMTVRLGSVGDVQKNLKFS